MYLNAALNQGRLLLENTRSEVRLLFKGGSYLRAALNNDFTVSLGPAAKKIKGEFSLPKLPQMPI